jgi:hypothetical protein
LEGKLDAAEKAKSNQTAIDAAVQKRLALLTSAQKVGLKEVKMDTSDKDIQIAVIKKVFPTANLDGKSDEYIQARFDSAMEANAVVKDGISRQISQGGDIPSSEGNADGEPEDSNAVRQKMIDRQRADSRSPIKNEEV